MKEGGGCRSASPLTPLKDVWAALALTLAAEELTEQEALTLNWVAVLCEQAAQVSLPLLAT